LVEHHLAKVGVAGSSPVSRSDRWGGSTRSKRASPFSIRRRGQVVRQRTANPRSPVRIRAAPCVQSRQRVRQITPSDPPTATPARMRTAGSSRGGQSLLPRMRAQASSAETGEWRPAPFAPSGRRPVIFSAPTFRLSARPPQGVQAFPDFVAGEVSSPGGPDRRLKGCWGVPDSVWTQNGHKNARECPVVERERSDPGRGSRTSPSPPPPPAVAPRNRTSGTTPAPALAWTGSWR
jgi:hypothetical protein